MPFNCRARGRHIMRTQEWMTRSRGSRRSGTLAVNVHQTGGPWLFGRFSIVDAMFVPVALRFVTYGVVLKGAAGEYMDHGGGPSAGAGMDRRSRSRNRRSWNPAKWVR